MIKVVLRTTDPDLLLAAFEGLGIPTRDKDTFLEEGFHLKTENQICLGNTPFGGNDSFIDERGHIIVTVLMTEKQAAFLPDYLDPPEFVCDWMTGVVVEDENGEQTPLPWPAYDIEWVDENGKTQAGRQEAGRIS